MKGSAFGITLGGGINIITIWADRLVRDDLNQMKTNEELE